METILSTEDENRNMIADTLQCNEGSRLHTG